MNAVLDFFNNANGVLTFFATLFSGISLISVIVVIAEWEDTHRPHLQATFDLVRGSQACIVIKNVGNVPAYLTSLSFNRDFVEQLDCGGQEHLKDRGNLQMTLFPQQWILPLTTTTRKIFEFSNRTLIVSMIYSYSDVKRWQLRRKKPFKETSIINFDDYAYFLEYISDTDELRKALKETNKELSGIKKAIQMIGSNNSERESQNT